MRKDVDKNGRAWRFGRLYKEWLHISTGYSNSVGMFVELPSEWHDEDDRASFRLSLLILHLRIMFPWYKKYDDHGQCSGPRFGFQFYSDLLWIYYGNDTGRSVDRNKYYRAFYMPWSWKHNDSKHVKGEDEGPYEYRYKLKSGEVQVREAMIHEEYREWWRFWIPSSMNSRAIWVSFNAEVGEQTGSWKGGVMGCGYEMLPHETPLMTLKRMERERIFD